ncbi:response regulator [Azospirillum sp. TSO22-1]|uniref:response regulator n=1 Tax=Azospirillum sp. TSO22-1 TaxID=716789 RepID=UPI000D61ADFD|nr:response regulator [Azospirillum sp. TSO22-1]PWC35582.1 chemotaxis protein CheY [Azospirillum sp. TSO22-1]
MDQHKILLVEDNADDVELTLHAFRASRVANEVVVMRDGETALDYLFGTGAYAGRDVRDLPALVLLDLKLPGIGGIEVLRALRARPETRRVPVVVLTTSDETTDVGGCYDLGVNSYIRKPVAFDAFNDVVNQLGLYWLVTNTPPPQ